MRNEISYILCVVPAAVPPFRCSLNCKELNDMTFKQLQSSLISDITFSMLFTSMHKLLKFKNTSTNVLNDNIKFLQLKH